MSKQELLFLKDQYQQDRVGKIKMNKFEKHKCPLVQNSKDLHTYNEISTLWWQPLYQVW